MILEVIRAYDDASLNDDLSEIGICEFEKEKPRDDLRGVPSSISKPARLAIR